MSANNIKRIGNLLFAGAVVVGAACPLSAEACAAELPPVSSAASGVLQYTDSEQDKSKIVLLSAGDTATDLPTLEEYLGKLVCSGCGRRCPLTSPQCRRGNSYVQSATADYEVMAAGASVVVDLEPSTADVSVPEESAIPAPEPIPSAETNPETATTAASVATVHETSAMDVADKAMEFLPLAGLACDGVYFGLDSLRKRKQQ